METNGLSNILAIISIAKLDKKIDDETYAAIIQQCDILERYMFAMHDVIEGNREEVPYWHEVRENPKQFRCTRNG